MLLKYIFIYRVSKRQIWCWVPPEVCLHEQCHLWPHDRRMPVWPRILWPSLPTWWELKRTKRLCIFCIQITIYQDALCNCDFFFKSKACPPGFHGHRCQLACNCQGKAQCDARTGQCLCLSGYQGEHCEKGKEEFLQVKPLWKSWSHMFPAAILSECEQGSFGPDCAHICDCDENTPCDPVTGKCLCGPGKMGSRCDTSRFNFDFLFKI